MATTVNSTSTSSLLEQINSSSSTQTSKGTKIVKSTEDLDKNAFLRILSAELSNQDPTNAKDGTEYVAQMAQFAGLEQMANLNATMRLVGANSLIGKVVTLNKYDDTGNLYSGEVKSVSKDGDEITLKVITGQTKNSEDDLVDQYEEFDMNDITGIESKGSSLLEE